MIRPIGPLRNAWLDAQRRRVARSGPSAGTLDEMLGVLDRLRDCHDRLESLAPDDWIDFLATHRVRKSPPPSAP